MPERMCLRAEAPAVLARRHRHEHLGGDDHFVPRQEFRHQPAGRDLAGAARVRIGGVEEGDPALDGGPDDGLGVVLVDDPGPVTVVPESHHAETDPRDPSPDVPRFV